MGLKDRLLRTRRRSLAFAPLLLLLAGCSQETQAGRFGLPEAISDRAPHIGNLWYWAWWTAWIVGILVWGLMGYAAIRFRRRKGDGPPRQTRYNLPMEIMYTLVPILIVSVLFVFTARTEHAVLAKDPAPQHTIDVVGQKWSWTFNYREAQNGQQDVWEAGTIQKIPDLYLPLDESVRFNLTSPDVIHSFWVPEFYFKLDVIPGHPNSFDLTPTKAGSFEGKCAELCGTYHSAMLFHVHVVPRAEFDQRMSELAARGQTGVVLGPKGGVTLVTPEYATKKEGE